MAVYYTTRQRDRLDRICFGWYGTLTGTILERVLAQNPGLASQPPVLPAGVEIYLPDAPKNQSNITKISRIKLWD